MPSEEESPSVGWRDMRFEMGVREQDEWSVGDSPWVAEREEAEDATLADYTDNI